MLLLFLLFPLGLAMADTDPRDFSRLCDSDTCPIGWKKVDAGCIMFAGWEEVRAREVCRENRAEYSEWVMMREESDSATRHSLPVCLVRRETQCQCGRPNRESNIVGGVKVEKNEYPWQVRLSMTGSDEICGGSILTREKILTAAHCTEDYPAQNITVWTRDHDITKRDGEVRHAVCSKTEHPEYFKKRPKFDQDIAVLHLCQPLMFSEGKFSK